MASVKIERHDEREINEMARKIVEQNRAKMAAPLPGMYAHSAAAASATRLQPVLCRPAAAAAHNGHDQIEITEEKHFDESSRRGRFGWCEFEKNFIPYLVRSHNEKYTSVRMVERKLLNKFLTVLPPEVNTCHCIRSYYISDAECRLLNEINLKHSDGHFGKDAFTSKDLVVRLNDAKEFYHFLDLCNKKLVLKRSNSSDKCGFFRINGESVVPYTVNNGTKFVPLFYFEGDTELLKLKSETVDGWDLAYLKFCCKVQGIRNELFAADTCRVVALDEIKQHFPIGTTFEDYWPAKGSIEPVPTQRPSATNWIQKPPPLPAAIAGPTVVHKAPASVAPPPAHPLASAAPATANYGGYPVDHTMMQSAPGRAAHAATMPGYDNHVHAIHQLLRSSGNISPYITSSHAAAAATAQQHNAIRAAVAQQAAAAAYVQQAVSYHHLQQQSSLREKQFPGKLTQIKEFPLQRTHQPPYKLQRALIDQKVVPCINVRPHMFTDLMITLPDLIHYFYPDLSVERARHMLQDVLKVVLYKGNSGHQEILRKENKCIHFDPVPLVLIKDVMNYMPQMKYMFNSAASEPLNKRLRVN